MSVLNVAEKPSVASGATKLLTRDWSNAHSLSRYNPCYQFDYEGRTHYFTSVSGHVFEHKFQNQKYNTCWSAFNPVDLLVSASIKQYVGERNKDIVSNLTAFAKKAVQLNLWLDCDREGEAIAFQVIKICTAANPRLRILRAKFSAVTFQEVTTALRTLVEPNRLLSDSVSFRQQIDYRIGSAFTVFQTVALQQKGLIAGKGKFVSYGPCQIPTLGFVVFRDLEIKKFRPEPFFEIRAGYQNDRGEKIELKNKRGRIYDQFCAEVIYLSCYDSDSGTTAHISRSRSRTIRKFKPKPMATLDLQKIGSQKLKIPASQIMDIAQKLYQKGFISYPRTQTNKFAPSIDLEALLQKQKEGPWGRYVEQLLAGGFDRPRGGDRDDKAHPPIHPVLPLQEADCTPNEWKVYELVVRHFVACCSKDAVGEERTIEAEVGQEEFQSKGVLVRQLNYLQVYPYEKWFETVLPQVREGDRFAPTYLRLDRGTTTAPLHLSEAELLGLMDKHGIGTDATMTEHLETIQKREFAAKNNGRFVPTELGLNLVRAYESLDLGLASPFIRASMEESMRGVAEGRVSREQALARTLQAMKEVLFKLQLNSEQFVYYFQHLE